VETNVVPEEVKEQAARLRRGALSIVPENGLEEKLARSARTGKPLKIKLGLDPTAPDIHLGFAVVLRKLRQFQDLGHEVIIIIGDYTALIGDPSGRSATRPMLSLEEIQENAATYVDQLARILDRSKTTVRFNGEWLGKLDFAEVVRLASRMTVAQVMQREDFANRYSQHLPISLHELLYPLAQAYDSVAIEADVEMGGQDQTFNILAGRELQKELGQDQQIAFFMPLLVGLDGVKKMSKSLGNYVGVAESPDAMFGKLMSISDEAMRTYFILCTDVPEQEIEAILAAAASGTVNPKDAKRRLAREVIAIYHGSPAADAADQEWNRVHSEKEMPSEIPEAMLPNDVAREGRVWACRLLVGAGMAKGTGDARRLIAQGGVVLNGDRLDNPDAELPLGDLAGAVLRVGPRRFVRLRLADTA
jgi:tyrosyl-tRNA synthetase